MSIMFSKMSYSVFRAISASKQCTLQLSRAGYKSQYSLDKLYPNSSLNFTNIPSLKHTNTESEFSGYIPIENLDIRYSRSSGPGGQNVNKVNTKVEVRFHVENSKWIPEFAKSKLVENEFGRITKEGYLIVRSDKTRKQMLNRADCLDRIRSMVWEACRTPREPSPEELLLAERRKGKAKQEVLREKREKSLKKSSRKAPGMYS